QRSLSSEHRRHTAERASEPATNRCLISRGASTKARVSEVLARIVDAIEIQLASRLRAGKRAVGVVHEAAVALPREPRDAGNSSLVGTREDIKKLREN